MNKVLEIKDLHVSFYNDNYAGEAKAVRGINLEVMRGEAVAIVGESGCGKSVTAQAILRLLPSPPAVIKQGSIYFNGEDLLKKSERQMQQIRGRKIGIIFQDPMTSLNPTMKIGRQVAEGPAKHLGLSKSQARKRALEILELVAMTEPQKRMLQYPHELSGGMRQRAMIAIAIACEPELLIADEPTTSLDPTIQAQILELLRDLQIKLNTSIILISHDLGVVAKMCSRIAVMYAGKIVEAGTAEQIFYNPLHPYTRGLLDLLPRLDSEKNRQLNPIKGAPPTAYDTSPGCPFLRRCKYAMQVCHDREPGTLDAGNNHRMACWLHAGFTTPR